MQHLSGAGWGGWRAIACVIALVGLLYGCGASESGGGATAGADQTAFALRQDDGGSSSTPPPPASGDVVAPSAPTGLSGTAASPSRVNLSWTASTDAVGVKGYRVFRNGALLITLGN